MIKKINRKDKILKETINNRIANIRGVNSTMLLGLKASIAREDKKLKLFLKNISKYKQKANKAMKGLIHPR